MKRISLSVALLTSAGVLFAQPVLKNLSSTRSDADVLFIGAENNLVLEGLSDHKDVELTANNATIRKGSNGGFTAMVAAPKPVKIEVYRKGKNGKQLMLTRVFQPEVLSRPEARIGNSTDSSLTVDYISANPVLKVIMPNSQFKHSFVITFFNLTITSKSGELILPSSSNRLTAEQIAIIKSLSTGDKLSFDEIRTTCASCRNIKLPGYTISVK